MLVRLNHNIYDTLLIYLGKLKLFFRSGIIGKVFVALAGAASVLIATNELVYHRIESERVNAYSSYYNLLNSLGSNDPAVRAGAISQIPVIAETKASKNEETSIIFGLEVLSGARAVERVPVFHENMLLVTKSLLAYPKPLKRVAYIETNAVIDMLGALGQGGWYMGSVIMGDICKEMKLQWIWQNAPDRRITNQPASVIFESSYLVGAEMSRYLLKGASFLGADLYRVNYDDSDLTNASFRQAKLNNVSFRQSILLNVDFTGAELINVDFTGAIMDELCLKGADLKHCKGLKGSE